MRYRVRALPAIQRLKASQAGRGVAGRVRDPYTPSAAEAASRVLYPWRPGDVWTMPVRTRGRENALGEAYAASAAARQRLPAVPASPEMHRIREREVAQYHAQIQKERQAWQAQSEAARQQRIQAATEWRQAERMRQIQAAQRKNLSPTQVLPEVFPNTPANPVAPRNTAQRVARAGGRGGILWPALGMLGSGGAAAGLAYYGAQ